MIPNIKQQPPGLTTTIDMLPGYPVISCGILPQQELEFIFQPEETDLQENSNLMGRRSEVFSNADVFKCQGMEDLNFLHTPVHEDTQPRDRKVKPGGQMKEKKIISSPPAPSNQPALFRARARSVK